jgi:hypothetical protein
VNGTYQARRVAAKPVATLARLHGLKSVQAIVRFVTDTAAPSVRFMIKAGDQRIVEAIAHLT